jgi:hypothetical protein
MKKRSSPKLKLNLETIRTLGDPDLTTVVGGASPVTSIPCASTGIPCITYTCSSWIAHCDCTEIG